MYNFIPLVDSNEIHTVSAETACVDTFLSERGGRGRDSVAKTTSNFNYWAAVCMKRLCWRTPKLAFSLLNLLTKFS